MEICEPVQMEPRAYINKPERSVGDSNEVDVYSTREGHGAAKVTNLGMCVGIPVPAIYTGEGGIFG